MQFDFDLLFTNFAHILVGSFVFLAVQGLREQLKLERKIGKRFAVVFGVVAKAYNRPPSRDAGFAPAG